MENEMIEVLLKGVGVGVAVEWTQERLLGLAERARGEQRVPVT